MKTAHSRLYPELEKTIDRLDLNTILEERKLILSRLINYIQSKVNEEEEIKDRLDTPPRRRQWRGRRRPPLPAPRRVQEGWAGRSGGV